MCAIRERYSGINIGTITKIEMTETGLITIQMTVEEKTGNFIKKDVIASIGSDGLVGSMVVNIVPGNDPKAAVVVSGDTIQSQKKIGTDDMLSTLSKTNENVALLTSDLLKMTHEILEGKGTVGTLINDTILAKNIQQTVVELRKISEETNLAISRVNQIISKVNYDESVAAVILSDTAAANQIKTIFVDLEKSSRDINEVTTNLNDYIVKIKSGKGIVNQLIENENLSQDLDSTMNYIKQAADKLNLNMEALKSNFLFRGYFKKEEKKAGKGK